MTADTNEFKKAGATLGESLAAISQNLRAAQEAWRADLSPEQRDRASQARYEVAVAPERIKGSVFIKAHAARVRREMGL
jgi:hypothetical protein